MQEIVILKDLLAILLTAFIGGFIMRKLRLPTLLGYLLGGLALGYFVPELILKKEDLVVLGEIGVALLLFTLGVELSFDKLKKVGKVALIGSILQIIILGLLSMLFLPKFFGFSPQTGLFIGIVFSLSSTAVVAKILSDSGAIDTAHGEILVAWLLVQDLAVVPILIFLPILLTSQSYDAVFFSSLLTALVKTAFIIFTTYLLGRKILAPFAKRVLKDINRELFLIVVILLAIFSTYLFTLLGLPGSVGAFLAGLIISGRTVSHAVFSEIRPFRDLFSAIFFVLLGTIVNLTFILENIGSIVYVGIFEMAIVFLTTIFILIWFGLHTKTIFLTAIGLLSVGEFAFVVSGTFFTQGIITREVYSLVLSVSLLSLLLTPWQIQTAPALYLFLKRLIKNNLFIYNRIFGRLDFGERGELKTAADVIVCGHGRVGREISLILQRGRIPFVVIDFNKEVLLRLADRGVETLYGDPADYEILDLAGTAKARVLMIALPDRHSQEMIIRNALKLNPNITIICRSHFDEDRIPLLSIGANVIVQPEFEAGVAMARLALLAFGKKDGELEEYILSLKKGMGI